MLRFSYLYSYYFQIVTSMSVDTVLSLQRTCHRGSTAADTFTQPGQTSLVHSRDTMLVMLYELAVTKPGRPSVVTTTLTYMSLVDYEVTWMHTRLASIAVHFL